MATKRSAEDQGTGSGEPPTKKKHATLQPVNIGTIGNLVSVYLICTFLPAPKAGSRSRS